MTVREAGLGKAIDQIAASGPSLWLGQPPSSVSRHRAWSAPAAAADPASPRRRLRRLTAAMMIKGTVVVYSIPACPHCRSAKATLAQRGLQYVDVDLERFPHLGPWLTEATGKTSVPQIFFNSRHIGGNSELQLLVSSVLEGLAERKCVVHGFGSALFP